MRRGVIVATLLGAVLVGSTAGVGLHAWRPDPLGLRPTASTTGTELSPSPSNPQPSPTNGSTSNASPSPSETPSATPSHSPSHSPSPSHSANPTHSSPPDPAFDRTRLMRTTDFTGAGWTVARVTASYPQLPDPPITPCVSIGSGDPGVVQGYAGAWSSDHTQAEEVIAQYADEAAAEQGFTRLIEEITDCPRSTLALTSFARTEEASAVDAIRWFDTRSGADDALGVIGVVRTGDKLALFYMRSADSDPDDTHQHGTTDVAALLGIAGQRLA